MCLSICDICMLRINSGGLIELQEGSAKNRCQFGG
jgi:hypothetical protein